jgi:hypothetical protein
MTLGFGASLIAEVDDVDARRVIEPMGASMPRTVLSAPISYPSGSRRQPRFGIYATVAAATVSFSIALGLLYVFGLDIRPPILTD